MHKAWRWSGLSKISACLFAYQRSFRCRRAGYDREGRQEFMKIYRRSASLGGKAAYSRGQCRKKIEAKKSTWEHIMGIMVHIFSLFKHNSRKDLTTIECLRNINKRETSPLAGAVGYSKGRSRTIEAQGMNLKASSSQGFLGGGNK
jgi:hypothetical protein